MEEVELVDEQDAVVGKAEREEAHDKQLLHHSVHIIMVNSEGRFLRVKKPE